MPGWQAAGKTGTSQDWRDAWFIGYTSHLVAGVWLGNDDNSPTKKASGGNLPVEIWSRFMRAAHQGVPSQPLPGGIWRDSSLKVCRWRKTMVGHCRRACSARRSRAKHGKIRRHFRQRTCRWVRAKPRKRSPRRQPGPARLCLRRTSRTQGLMDKSGALNPHSKTFSIPCSAANISPGASATGLKSKTALSPRLRYRAPSSIIEYLTKLLITSTLRK